MKIVLSALIITAASSCQVPCRVTDTECYDSVGCGCIRYGGDDFETFLSDNNFEACDICGGFSNCDQYFDGCNNCICMENGESACNKKGCDPDALEPKKCIACVEGYKLDNDGVECIPECTPDGATFVGDFAFCQLARQTNARFGCDEGFEYWWDRKCGCGCKPSEPTITCANVLCEQGNQCFDTSLGPICIPEGGVGPACGGTEEECKDGYECVSGTCVNPTYEEPEPEPCEPVICPAVEPCSVAQCEKDEKCVVRTPLIPGTQCPGCPVGKCRKKRKRDCGNTLCPKGQVCCDPLCGKCTPPGGFCTLGCAQPVLQGSP